MYVNSAGDIIDDNAPYRDESGVQYPPNFPKDQVPGLTKVTETGRPAGVVVTGFSVVDGVQVWQSRPLNAQEKEARKNDALARLAAKRFEVEAGGTVVADTPVDTDREAQSKLVAVRIVAKEDPAYSVKWKTPAGFTVLDAPTIIAIADAVRAHVQACFDHEATLADQIEKAADPDSIDINAGWPAN